MASLPYPRTPLFPRLHPSFPRLPPLFPRLYPSFPTLVPLFLSLHALLFPFHPISFPLHTPYFCHPHRPTQMLVSTDADIRTDRRRHPHRPTRTSVSTDADIRIDRRGWLFFYFTCAPVPRCRAVPCRSSASFLRSERERGAPPSPLRCRHRG